ncbi:DNA methyltransferase [Pseudanabaena mucicola]|uniref:site-specific DNA-methyltransferase (adenine-specific) n=1 Tax=Pseudanabaena mucicola FACHB-723 TaxID=2692860 RepID=A0ABR7ZY41_9CYAN|nr:DNA methyltransferase [Pseudanabaena mucicola]MBD2188484.1 class I SAM-dependent DNA methyltransferase [Pseudanabaena mucicola FACHB-723]
MPDALQDFVKFHATLNGDEKSESQIFLDRFFQAFHHKGAIEAGAVYEQRVKKGSAKGKTGFADLVWKRPESNGKGGVLIEMKKRGEDLNKHYSQAFQYWTYLVPDRPRYVVLCNFDEFWIYDFNLQVDTPVDTIAIADLPDRSSAFRFMEIAVNTTPVFRNNQVEVTINTAKRLGELYRLLKTRAAKDGFTELIAQKFILQCVLAMFAEDRGLLPDDLFVACVQDCLNGESSYDLLGRLFQEMNLKGITPAGRYKGVDYFNGGLFAEIYPIELNYEELKILDTAARENWGKIRPAIFGSIFEATSDSKERHARGMHFTSEVDIMKIVVPTITRYWEEKIDAANTIADLNALQLELQAYRVLDPACGSGNFLYLAYQELKRIEVMLLAKLASKQKTISQQVQMGLVTPNQFFGMDINPFAVELARVTLMIARKVAIDKHGLSEPALPLDTLDKNIVCQDALFSDWFEADAIIGNPPFLGAKHMRLNLSDEYIDRIFAKFPDIKDVDFCAYWFRLTHDLLSENTRAGLVGTNSISQGKSRKVSLEYAVDHGGVIHDAVSSQEWSGDAAVYVSIVNWCKQETSRKFLDSKEVLFINSSLKAEIDVTKAAKLKANSNQCFQGVIPVGKGFIVTEDKVKAWIKADPKNQEVLKLFSMGDNLASNPHGQPERWIIDFSNLALEDVSEYKLPFAHVKTNVKPERENNREAVMREKWWRFKRTNEAMRKALAPLEFAFAVPRVSKWAVFIPFPKNWLAGDLNIVFASDDFYKLGILTSQAHRLWVKAQSSSLGETTRYTHNTCFETFPFPQNKTSPLVAKIRTAMQELHQYRTEQMESKQWGITKLYNEYFHEPASQLYKLHAKLDKLVMQLYGFSDSDDLLEKLLHLNQAIAAQE